MKLARLLLITAVAAGLATAQSPKRVFNGITAPATSSPLPNAGQAVHVMALIFPDATTDLADFSARIEASFDNSIYFPISEDITSATYDAAGGFAYSITRANGLYPFVRLRVTDASAQALTAYYAAGQYPIGRIVISSGRVVTQAPASSSAAPATWGVCVSAVCATGTNLTNNFIVPGTRTLEKCFISAKTAPTGASLIVDINVNGTSIFSGSKLTLTAGSTYATATNFASTSLAEGDILTIDIDQVGSTVAGQYVTVTCSMQ